MTTDYNFLQVKQLSINRQIRQNASPSAVAKARDELFYKKTESMASVQHLTLEHQSSQLVHPQQRTKTPVQESSTKRTSQEFERLSQRKPSELKIMIKRSATAKHHHHDTSCNAKRKLWLSGTQLDTEQKSKRSASPKEALVE